MQSEETKPMTDVSSIAANPAVVAVLADLARGATLDDEGAAVLTEVASDSVPDGSRLQLEVMRRHLAAGARVGGWKIGWTSRSARSGPGADGARPFGYVLEDRVLTSETVLDLDAVPDCKLEPEIALVLGAPLSGPAVTRAEARAAVSAVAPAFEVLSSRLRPGMSLAVRVGNALNNWGIVVGRYVPVDSVDLSGLELSLIGDGYVLATGSSGPEVLDDPFESLATVATYLHSFGERLEAGQVLITGSLCAPVKAEPGMRYEAVLGDLGSVSVRC
jgi:2-keto-4-pentenoate hydratase